MPSGDEVFGGGRRVAAALLFMGAGQVTFDVYSALNSSPWTSENFGADPEKAKSSREYVLHAMGWSTFYCVAAGVIGGTWWPIFGMALNNAYMWWLYERALARGAAAGSTDWQQSQDQTVGSVYSTTDSGIAAQAGSGYPAAWGTTGGKGN